MKPAYSGKLSQSRGSLARKVMTSTFNDHKMSDAETERENNFLTENILRASTEFCSVIQFQQDHILSLCIVYQETAQLALNIPRGGPLRTPEGDFLWSCRNYIN